MAGRAGSTPDRWFARAETVVYGLVAALLVGAALVVLVSATVSYVDDVTNESVVFASTELLAGLLLVFVFVELLGAVRTTIREQRLVAEPFLLVGIIASIKEIVVVAGAERPTDAPYPEFRDAMIEIGVLAAIVLALAIAALLLRRREREPAETDA